MWEYTWNLQNKTAHFWNYLSCTLEEKRQIFYFSVYIYFQDFLRKRIFPWHIAFILCKSRYKFRNSVIQYLLQIFQIIIHIIHQPSLTSNHFSSPGEDEGEENSAPTQTESATDELAEAQSPHSERSKASSPELESTENTEDALKQRSGEKRPLESDGESNSLSPKILPTLRLNVALASDPASNPEAKELRKIKSEDSKADEDDMMGSHEDTDSVLESVNLSKATLKAQLSLSAPKSKENCQRVVNSLEMLPRPNVFMCTPCGIRFSSLSTLEAHQTYYCSHRKNADESANADGANADTNGGEPPTKSIKTGKQYACTQCSYSADKKVSLNRHMRMHQTSPAPSSTTSNGDETPSQIIVQQIIGQPPQQPIVVDRYCSNCDIRFSSTKTYRAHKQHYCSGRHRDG